MTKLNLEDVEAHLESLIVERDHVAKMQKADDFTELCRDLIDK